MPQKPRRASGEEANQLTAPSIATASRGAEVAATWWPELRRHCEQWQATIGRRGASVR